MLEGAPNDGTFNELTVSVAVRWDGLSVIVKPMHNPTSHMSMIHLGRLGFNNSGKFAEQRVICTQALSDVWLSKANSNTVQWTGFGTAIETDPRDLAPRARPCLHWR